MEKFIQDKEKMKKIILFLFLINLIFADEYYVEVDKITKENKSDYILKTGKILQPISADRIRIKFDTQNEYNSICGDINWEQKWIDYMAIKENSDKIEMAISDGINAANLDKKINLQKSINAINTLITTAMPDELIILNKKKVELQAECDAISIK